MASNKQDESKSGAVVDVVNDAFANVAMVQKEKPASILWSVRLVGESEVRIGKIESLGTQSYVLWNEGSDVGLFFSADKVLFIIPQIKWKPVPPKSRRSK